MRKMSLFDAIIATVNMFTKYGSPMRLRTLMVGQYISPGIIVSGALLRNLQLQSLSPRYLHRLNVAVVSASSKFAHKLDAEVSDRC